MKVSTHFRLAALAMLLLMCVACRQVQQPAASDIVLEMAASELQVGATILTLRVHDKQGNPLTELGTVSLRGDMEHAGMTPVLAQAESTVAGFFAVPFEWTMAGSWIVEASLPLATDEVLQKQFHFEVAAPSAGHAMAMPSGANSAAYMRIKNRFGDDQVFVSASSDIAAAVEFHETRVLDGVASMTRLEELPVPGHGELLLEPGGKHLMLLNLTQDLQVGEYFIVDLFNNLGQLHRVEFLVSEPPASELDDSVELANFIFSNRWARPASAG